MKNKKIIRGLLPMAITSAFGASYSHGADFYFGNDQDIQLQVNSQLSVGASWRTEDADDALVGATNGGTGGSATTDDGNLNFDKGETFSQIIKGSHDIQLSKGDFGAFTRFKYWQDFELEDGNRDHGNSGSGYASGAPLSDSGFSDNAKFSGISLLDAYVYGSFDVSDMPLDVRVGRQVVSWGESTFIQGGMNSSNPFDVSALRRPGATLKEGILPVGMAYFNLGATENLSIEAFYQYEWAKTEVDGCGTLFGADFAASGCNYVTFGADDATALAGGLAVERTKDEEAKDDGQYGLALRYFAEELNNTEFGIYAMNIHSRAPLASGTKNTVDEVQIVTDIITSVVTPIAVQGQTDIATAIANGDYLANSQAHQDAGAALQATMDAASAAAMPTAQGAAVAQIVASSNYFLTYPEDIIVTGLSFATNVGSMALSGEISHKIDAPIQINGPMVIGTLVTGSSTSTELNADYLNTADGAVSDGFRLFDISQVQVTAIKFFDQVAGASRMTLIGEAGYTYIHDFNDSPTAIKYGRSDIFGSFDPTDPNGNEGFVTQGSWGYRGRLVADYSDVFMGINLKPTVAWSHDVKGYAPQPGGNFGEGQKTLGLSVLATYLETYSANLSYTRYSGGDYSVISDHDFASISMAVQF